MNAACRFTGGGQRKIAAYQWPNATTNMCNQIISRCAHGGRTFASLAVCQVSLCAVHLIFTSGQSATVCCRASHISDDILNYYNKARPTSMIRLDLADRTLNRELLLTSSGTLQKVLWLLLLLLVLLLLRGYKPFRISSMLPLDPAGASGLSRDRCAMSTFC
jgi:hypothetical protein